MNTWATHAYDKDGNEINPDYGVPTGVVPRVEYQPPLRRSAVARAAVLHRECATMPEAERCGQCKSADPIQQAIDDFFLMERKASAWDELVAFSKLEGSGATQVCAKVHDLVFKLRA